MRETSGIQQVTAPGQLRNVVLVGHSGSGKTTLFEHFLKKRLKGYRAEPDTSERTSTLALAGITVGQSKVTLIDAPGHPDFVGELRAGLRAADAAVFVVSAADGIDPATASLWRECAAVGKPRCIVVTKLDAGKADFWTTLSECQQRFGDGVLPTHVPVAVGDQQVGSILSLISGTYDDYTSGAKVESEPDADLAALVEEHRPALVEGIITESEDDDLMERYLEGDEVKVDALIADLLTAVEKGHFHPVLPVSTHTGIGIEELEYIFEHGFPSPVERRSPEVTTPGAEVWDPITADPAGPLVAEVVATTSDAFAGRRSVVRIFSGTLTQDAKVHVSGHRSWMTGKEEPEHPDHEVDEQVGPISRFDGNEVAPASSAMAGEIVVVGKLAHAETSDTLSDPARPALIEPWVLPEPLLPFAIRPVTRGDEDKLAVALQRLAVEDTTLRLERAAETHQLILWTMGQAHVDLVMARLKDRYQVNVESEEVMVSLRETFIAPAKAHGRHVKQSGGHGQFAVCDIEIEPMERGGGYEFVDKVVGGAVPRQFIPSVDKGVQAQMTKGVVYGYPMVDVRVTLFDGKAHSVDSSDMAFQVAGSLALKEAANEKTVGLLEPIDEITVTVAEEFLGDVMSDLTGRRGHLLGTDAGEPGMVVIHALVPRLELSRYAIDLRGLARGSGSFTKEAHGYELMPAQVAAKLTAH